MFKYCSQEVLEGSILPFAVVRNHPKHPAVSSVLDFKFRALNLGVQHKVLLICYFLCFLKAGGSTFYVITQSFPGPVLGALGGQRHFISTLLINNQQSDEELECAWGLNFYWFPMVGDGHQPQ